MGGHAETHGAEACEGDFGGLLGGHFLLFGRSDGSFSGVLDILIWKE